MDEIPVECLRLNDRVKFRPDSVHVDRVRGLLLRDNENELLYGFVTVTHETGCWSRRVNETVILVERGS